MGRKRADPPRAVAFERPGEPFRGRELPLGVLIGDGPPAAMARRRRAPGSSTGPFIPTDQPFMTWVRYVLIPVSGGDPLMSVTMVAISLR